MTMHDVPALLQSLPDVVKEFETKRDGIDQLIEDYERFHKNIDMSTTVSGTYVGRVYDYHPNLYRKRLEENLLKSAWRHVYNKLNIKHIASAKDRNQFDLSLENPPDFTEGNVRATFEGYWGNQRHHILKGLAECFVDLDPAFKSHSKVKVGVSGLPKRIIIQRVCGDYGLAGYGADQLKDTINALNVFQGDPHIEYREFADLREKAFKEGEATYKGLTIRVFKNGNGHLIFSPHKLQQINDALAEFYGDTLPDSPEDVVKKRPGTAVSKDLAYYPTPYKVISEVIRRAVPDHLEDKYVLEPSCGDGAILQALREKHPEAQMLGIEVHGPRAMEARAKGFNVVTRNFLETTPQASFDLVVMNPPFNGQHWRKHVEHALKFLRPMEEGERGVGPMLITILPATAFYDGHLAEMGLTRPKAHLEDRGWVDSGWYDLPVASFAESGTNVPTGYFITRGERW